MSDWINTSLLQRIKRAIGDYNMIKSGDVVAVGISGGKDSLSTLYALAELRKSLPGYFELHAITVDMGWPDSDWSQIEAFCQKIGVYYHVVKTQIGPIVFEHRQESNPCSLCSKMRNGALNNKAKALGCNVIALGHHRDDAIETLFLNLMYSGRIGCFSPITWLDRLELYSIRPMIYVEEATTQQLIEAVNLPVIKGYCPTDGETKRQHVKELLLKQYQLDSDMPTRILAAVKSLWEGTNKVR